MQKRREKNLCFNCDEKFVPGHKCKMPKVLMIGAWKDAYAESEPIYDQSYEEGDKRAEERRHIGGCSSDEGAITILQPSGQGSSPKVRELIRTVLVR